MIENIEFPSNQGCTVSPDAWNGFLMLFLFCCKPSSFIRLSFGLLAVLAMAFGRMYFTSFVFNLILQFFIILLISDRLIPIHSRSFWWNRDCDYIFRLFACLVSAFYTNNHTHVPFNHRLWPATKNNSNNNSNFIGPEIIECKQWFCLRCKYFDKHLFIFRLVQRCIWLRSHEHQTFRINATGIPQ